ncbi:MAG: FAD-dependent oxidoreductase, partial [Bacteroidota bacterium]
DTQFARLEDASIAPIIEQEFTNLGVTIHKNAHLSHVENKQALFDIKDGENIIGQERVAYDKVLIAIGRVPNFPAGLEAAGIEADDRC